MSLLSLRWSHWIPKSPDFGMKTCPTSPDVGLQMLFFPNQLLRKLDCTNGILRSAVRFDFLRPILCDRRATYHHFDSRAQAFLIQFLDYLALADHGRC